MLMLLLFATFSFLRFVRLLFVAKNEESHQLDVSLHLQGIAPGNGWSDLVVFGD